ncbi:uncharacterized protein A1O9_00257 [Exophiala aquamarina CBS 119918]|uniref:nitrilase n=1 Tax=Exophiala aquamarina CBS 119918 TaxID=1182545 RepID=A0A072Q337_9EURO|nr:uncharacterized protein A1O9_00257 [Exophiala aquamarina CBS 119918]KEF62285.1 hypothetical protein A1O9_00257 [Exophiala aquamarina CBS 119918]
MKAIPADSSQVRVAVTQSEPSWLDLGASVQKTCDLIREAGQNGAQLVAFPETWIPGYPVWIWDRPTDPVFHAKYIKNSLIVDSPEMKSIQAAAAAQGISVSLGFSERLKTTLFISQVSIDPAGQIVLHRRKMKPTHMERTIFGDGCESSLKSVVPLPFGRVGALACWEHVLPLLKFNTHLQDEQIHVAAWPPLFEPFSQGELWSMTSPGNLSLSSKRANKLTLLGARTISSAYAIEGGCFVLHSTAVISQQAIEFFRTSNAALFNTPGGGSSAIFGPDGRKLSHDLPDKEEAILYANIDLDEILKVKGFLDSCGHYTSPHLLWLGVNDEAQELKRAT